MGFLAKFKVYLIVGAIIASLIAGIGFMSKLYFEARVEKAMAIEAFDTYSRNAQLEAIEQNQEMAKLSNTYQEARDDELEQMAVFEGRDLGEVLVDMPDWFVSHSADATDKLFSDIESATRKPANNDSAATP